MAETGSRQKKQQQQLESLIEGATIRTALAFGVLGLIAALVLTPVLDNSADKLVGLASDIKSERIDGTITGSIDNSVQTPSEKPSGTVRYTIRRSVIHKNPAEPCYIFEDGSRRGGC